VTGSKGKRKKTLDFPLNKSLLLWGGDATQLQKKFKGKKREEEHFWSFLRTFRTFTSKNLKKKKGSVPERKR